MNRDSYGREIALPAAVVLGLVAVVAALGAMWMKTDGSLRGDAAVAHIADHYANIFGGICVVTFLAAAFLFDIYVASKRPS